MIDLLNDLNKEQLEAVTHDKGPLLIIAGAGTGKTTVIAKRIAWLIAERKALPEEVLALTFTDKAAAEMEERVDTLVPMGFIDSWISTFHAFGDRILRENALELGLPSDFKVLTFPEQMIFLKEHLFEIDLKILKPLSNPTKHLEALLKYFSRLKDEDISPKEFLDYVKRKEKKEKSNKEWQKQLEISRVYEKYEELMLKNGFLDFGDQIRLTLKLFRENPRILKKYREKFRYILVDEFQDSNYAQGEILEASYRLIQFNNPDRLEIKNKISKKLISERPRAKVSQIYADTLSSEADEVVKI